MFETVGDVIDALSEHDRDKPVRIAIQPGHPLELAVGGITVVEVSETGDGDVHEVVYIGAGSHLGYAPGVVSDALGW